MSDNTLLILGTFSLNLAILGGASYYLYSDFMSRLDDEKAVVTTLLTSQATLTDSLLSLDTVTTKNTSNVGAANSNLTGLSNAVNANVNKQFVSISALSNVIVGNSNDNSSTVTIQGYTGNSKLLFGTALSMGVANSVSHIDTNVPLNISNGGTGNIYLSGSDTNKVGINNMTPSYPLDVTGDINTSTNLNGTKLCLTNTPNPTCVTGAQLASLIKQLPTV